MSISLKSYQNKGLHTLLRPREWWEAKFAAHGARPNRAVLWALQQKETRCVCVCVLGGGGVGAPKGRLLHVARHFWEAPCRRKLGMLGTQALGWQTNSAARRCRLLLTSGSSPCTVVQVQRGRAEELRLGRLCARWRALPRVCGAAGEMPS